MTQCDSPCPYNVKGNYFLIMEGCIIKIVTSQLAVSFTEFAPFSFSSPFLSFFPILFKLFFFFFFQEPTTLSVFVLLILSLFKGGRGAYIENESSFILILRSKYNYLSKITHTLNLLDICD